MPELRSIEPLPPAELAIRLCYLYEHRMRNPVVDELEDMLMRSKFVGVQGREMLA